MRDRADSARAATRAHFEFAVGRKSEFTQDEVHARRNSRTKVSSFSGRRIRKDRKVQHIYDSSSVRSCCAGVSAAAKSEHFVTLRCATSSAGRSGELYVSPVVRASR